MGRKLIHADSYYQRNKEKRKEYAKAWYERRKLNYQKNKDTNVLNNGPVLDDDMPDNDEKEII